MPDLVDAAMKLQALAKKYFQSDPELKKVVDRMEPLFQQIYDGDLPPKKQFEALAEAHEEVFEEHDDLYDAFYDFSGVYDDTSLQRLRESLRGSIGERFVDHIQENWKERTCPACGAGDWLVPDCIYELREYHGGKLVLGGAARLMAVVPVVCEHCGLTRFFSAAHAGVSGHEPGKWPRLPRPG